MIESLYSFGVSISYNRMVELEDQLACAISTQFEKEGIVCPPNLRKGLLTVVGLDNVDHNTSSTTAVSFFHGTGISIFQIPSPENCGVNRDPIVIDSKSAGKCCLPENYATVPAVACKTDTLSEPESLSTLNVFQGFLDKAKKEELAWVDHGMCLLEKGFLQKEDYISWAAFHASQSNNTPPNPSAIISLLPHFYEHAAHLAMVKHGMEILRATTEFLNPGQIPIMTFDQPLFTLAK